MDVKCHCWNVPRDGHQRDCRVMAAVRDTKTAGELAALMDDPFESPEYQRLVEIAESYHAAMLAEELDPGSPWNAGGQS